MRLPDYISIGICFATVNPPLHGLGLRDLGPQLFDWLFDDS